VLTPTILARVGELEQVGANDLMLATCVAPVNVRYRFEALADAGPFVFPRPPASSGLDPLDEDPPFGRPDLVVELAQEVQPEEAVDVVVAEVEHVDREARHRDPEGCELGHAQEIAFLAADGRVDAGTLDAVARAVPEQSASSGVMVVKTAPVSSTKRLGMVCRGPVRSASTMIRSPSVAKEISCLFIEDKAWTGGKKATGTAAGIEEIDQVVVVPPLERLLDRHAQRLAVADDARGTKLEAVRMDEIHLDQAHPLVGISRADLGPRERLGDLGRYGPGSFGSTHLVMFGQEERVSSFRPAVDRRCPGSAVAAARSPDTARPRCTRTTRTWTRARRRRRSAR
jgi:hypothetical protein